MARVVVGRVGCFTMYPFSGCKRSLLCAVRASAGLERGGDRSAGPAGGRAARGERSEPP